MEEVHTLGSPLFCGYKFIDIFYHTIQIADELSASTVGMTRKRAQKDANVSKQKAMRFVLIYSHC